MNPTPHVELIAVYRLPLTPDLVDEQARILYGDDLPDDEWRAAVEQTRAQLEATVLVEVLVRRPDERFSVNDFTQPIPGESSEEWQAAWAEAYLSADGTDLLGRWEPPASLPPEFRVAFYVHDWRADAPLRTSYGELRCPAPIPMPERLASAVPYEPVD